jgi:PAS domain S-box-containing protein
MSISKRAILIVGEGLADLPQQTHELEASGFSVITAETSEDALALFGSQMPAAVVVDAGREGELDKLTAAIRKVNPRTPVVILAESAVVAENVRSLVDAMVLKAQTPSVLAHKLNSLIQIRSHSHPQLEGKYVAFADSSRHYVDCSDGVCDLLGYTRMELTGMTIDEASYRPQKVNGMFQEYMEKGQLEGQYILRHKSGKPVFIQYRSEIFPDGCMAAVWEPVEDWKQLYQSAMLEFDRTKLKDRVEVAQHAIEDRLRDLGQDRGGSSQECQQLRDALSGLRVLSREVVQV